MKVISLNCWAGKLYQPLIQFIQRQKEEIDIFSFQEVISGGPDKKITPSLIQGQLFQKLEKVLSDYQAYFAPAPKATFGVEGYPLEEAELGQAIFVKKSLLVMAQDYFSVFPKEEDPFLNDKIGDITGRFQYIDIQTPQKTFTLGNIHGIWQKHKDDSPERLKQSKFLLDFFQNKKNPHILIGDFNLRPETKSIAMLSEKMRNLIFENNIKTTRNRNYKNMEIYQDYIADYAFISNDITPKNFQVFQDEISDHNALLLEFN